MTAPATGHKFAVGDAVVFSPDGVEVMYQTAGPAKVIRLLPKNDGDYQYHIEIGPDGKQRRALESQLRLLRNA